MTKKWVARAVKASKTREQVRDAKRASELVKELYNIFKKYGK